MAGFNSDGRNAAGTAQAIGNGSRFAATPDCGVSFFDRFKNRSGVGMTSTLAETPSTCGLQDLGVAPKRSPIAVKKRLVQRKLLM